MGSTFRSAIGMRAVYIKPIVATAEAVFSPSLKTHKSSHQVNGLPSMSNKCKLKKIKSLMLANLHLFIE